MTADNTLVETRGVAPAPSTASSGLSGLLNDSWALTIRNLIHIRSNPERLLDATVQPIMFTVLFVYVFGGAIPVEGGYRDFLMPGIFVQTLAFSCFGTALGLAADRKSGFIDRLLALPTSRAALLVGRVTTDMLITCLTLTILICTGLVVGWRPHESVGNVALALGLMLLFSFSMTWLGVLLGCVVSEAEAVMGVGFIVLFPLTFIANTFVPTAGMPTVVRVMAEWNPISAVTAAARQRLGNTNPTLETSDAWPLVHPVFATLLLCAALTAIFAPLALARYRRLTRG
jgi:ABC transporter DrrB family efflux protein